MGAGLRRSFIGGKRTRKSTRRVKKSKTSRKSSTRRQKKSKTSRRSKTRRMKKKGGLNLIPNIVKPVGGLKPSELKMGDCVKTKYGKASYVLAVKGNVVLLQVFNSEGQSMYDNKNIRRLKRCNLPGPGFKPHYMPGPEPKALARSENFLSDYYFPPMPDAVYKIDKRTRDRSLDPTIYEYNGDENYDDWRTLWMKKAGQYY